MKSFRWMLCAAVVALTPGFAQAVEPKPFSPADATSCKQTASATTPFAASTMWYSCFSRCEDGTEFEILCNPIFTLQQCCTASRTFQCSRNGGYFGGSCEGNGVTVYC